MSGSRRAPLREGFIAPQLKLAVIPDHRLLRRRRAERAGRPAARACQAFTDLRAGDIVVHTDHGIGRFTGFDTKTVARRHARLPASSSTAARTASSSPPTSSTKLSRYVGADGRSPPLSKLGSKAWETMKARARRAARELAGELINIYAERKRAQRPPLRRGLRLAARVRARLPLPRDRRPARGDRADQGRHGVRAQPMDRLICGDVGYGKTEVALRAAFKAAERGQAGAVPGADDDPRPAALRHLLGAAARLPVPDRAAVALPLGQGAARR